MAKGAQHKMEVRELRRLIAVARGERPADLVLRGGLVAVRDGKVLARLPLPIAGLLAQEPLPRVAERLETLTQVARGLGMTLPHPFLS
jgi:adenine deaminase